MRAPERHANDTPRRGVDDEVRALIAEWDRLQDERVEAARAAFAPAGPVASVADVVPAGLGGPVAPRSALEREARLAALRRHRAGTRLLAAAAVAQAAVGSLTLAGASFAQPLTTLAPETLGAAQARPAGRFDAATARLLALMGMPQDDAADGGDGGDDEAAVAASAKAGEDGAPAPAQVAVGLDGLPVGAAEAGAAPAVVVASAAAAGPASMADGSAAQPTTADTSDAAGTESASASVPRSAPAPVQGPAALASATAGAIDGGRAPLAEAPLAGPTGSTPVPLGALAAATPTGGATTAVAGGGADEMAARLGGVALAVSKLEDYRGGFENSDHGNALRIRFSIERAIYVNGDLVATRVVGMDGLTSVDAMPMGSLMRGYGNAAATAAATAAASMPANALVIQNNLNDQQLRSQTAINAVVESSHLLRATRLDSIMRDVSTSSIAR